MQLINHNMQLINQSPPPHGKPEVVCPTLFVSSQHLCLPSLTWGSEKPVSCRGAPPSMVNQG